MAANTSALARRGLTALGALTAAASLAACASDHARAHLAQAPEPLRPTEQFKAEVTRQPEQVALAPHAQGLSPNQQLALSTLVNDWRANGGGELTVRTPTDGGDPRVNSTMTESMVSYLMHLGVPASSIRRAGYEPTHSERPPVLVDFARYAVEVPDCSGEWGDVTATGSNRPYDHFGCAVTADAAVQIANPRDLVAPETADAADNSRREVVLNKYRQGQTTSSAKDDQASGQVSQQQSQ